VLIIAAAFSLLLSLISAENKEIFKEQFMWDSLIVYFLVSVFDRMNDRPAAVVAEDVPENRFNDKTEIYLPEGSAVINVADICYAEYDLGIVMVYCKDGRSGHVSSTLAAFQATLDPQKFMRVSRTIIVNLGEVKEILSTSGRNKILTIDSPYSGKQIIITQSSTRELKQKLIK